MIRSPFALFFAIAVLIATNLAAQAEPQTETQPMVWHRGEAGDPASLDPHKTSTVVEGNVLSELYEGLVIYDNHGNLVPGVAARWSANADATVYTFDLRPDARWSNGDQVVADDFVFAFRRLMNPATGAEYANILYTVKNAEAVNKGKLPPDALGVRALDPATLEITLEHPVPYILEQLAHLTALPLHRRSVETFGDGFVRPGRMVSNGPFMLKSFLPNDQIVLVKNPYYYDAAHVALDAEIFVPIEDRSAALRRFMAGEIQSYDDVPVDQIAFVRSHLADSFKVSPNLATYYYAFDTRHKPFDDVRVRRALSLVIDRDFLATRIWGGTMEPSTSFVPPGIPTYGEPAQVAWADMNPFDREDEAKRLMQAAGFGPGHTLELTFRYNNSENHRATAVAIADMWKTLGVETHLFNTDATSHYAFLRSKAPFDVARSGWFGDFPDAENFLFLGESDNPLNVASYANPRYDALMKTAALQSGDTRSKTLHEAEALLLYDQPYLPLLVYSSRNLVSPKLRGWETNIIDHHPGRYISIAP